MSEPKGDPRGFKDTPISCRKDEFLGLKEYADGLAEFVRECDTPMTIALQGDWGSGKTSLMHLIREKLPATNIMKVWFNTWQYAQFSLGDSLAISLISRFIDQVTADKDPSAGARVKNTVRMVAKFMVAGAAKGIAAQTGIDAPAALKSLTPDDSDDVAITLTRLKEQLETFVRERKDIERIVVFIDDLDRLVPVKAVELLESLKLFLDIEKCVYVLAVDYQVVVRGLKEKFGVGETELKGKSFFDKIIQVPFNMPVTQYDVTDYFRHLLERLGLPTGKKDVDQYIELAINSVGFNPRTMKRLFNSLLLLQIVAKGKGVFESASPAKPHEVSKILFSILCMQQTFPEVYAFLASNQLPFSDKALKEFCDEDCLKSSQAFEPLRIRQAATQPDWSFGKLADFMRTFYGVLHLDTVPTAAKPKLSSEEIQALEVIFSFSSVVGTDTTSEQRPRTLNRQAFLESLTTPPDTDFFTPVLSYLYENDCEPTWGVRGFSIQNKKGKSVVQCYPSDARLSGFVEKNLSEDEKKALRAALAAKGIIKHTFSVSQLNADDFIAILAPLL